MRALVLGLCGACGAGSATSAGATQVSNQAAPSSTPTRCEPPQTLTLHANRRPNLDADDPNFGKTTPWNVILVRNADGTVHVVMDGDKLHWTFEASGVYDCAHAELSLDTHEPFHLELDVASRKGSIESIDDTWELY